MSEDILIIGDYHAEHGIDNSRAEIAGRFILDRKPSKVVQIGDFGDMPSLSSYDKGKRKFEGRRYKYDVEAVLDAQERLFHPIRKYNSQKKRSYEPDWYITLGNHENRINKATNDASELEEWIGIDDLQFEDYGWNVIPFKEVLHLCGLNFSHYFASGVMDRAIGGINAGRSLLSKNFVSSMVGHSHLFNCSTDVTPDNRRIWGMSVGCYFEHLHDYCSERTQQTYWRGLVLLKNVKDGDFDLELIRMETLKREYS